jgi:hypothetical protein
MNDAQQLFVKMALDAWGAEVKATSALLDKLSDDHLTAVHDQMLPLLRFQATIHPALYKPFHDEPDGAVAELPPITQLRAQWKEVNDVLITHMKVLPAGEWFTRHANISEEDFPKEPHRNRLNVVLSRTNHLAYHRGQLVLLNGR